MSRALVIVADDLTGACDTAGVIAGGADPVRVDVSWSGPPATGVQAIDLDSRAGDADRAVALTAPVVAEAVGAGADVYLKIDSTLRGHVAATVAAAADAFRAAEPFGRVVACPAFPARGRTVVDGRVLVDGTPRDSAVLRELAADPRVDVLDAATDADLAAIVAERAGTPVLWVGSAGLAAHVAGGAAGSPRRRTPGASSSSLGEGSGAWAMPTVASVAVVVGTEQAASISGGRDLRRRGDERIEVVDGDPRVRAMIERAAAAAARHAGLIVTGGFTARRLLDRLAVTSLLVGGELEPGIPWSTTLDGSRVLVTKAGGFGDRSTLARAVDRLLGTA